MNDVITVECSSVELCTRCDELARREQAAGVAGCPSCGFSFRLTSTASLEKGECAKCGADWPLHGKREQAQAAQHTPESRSASVAAFDGLAQTADEAFALISGLAAENDRLRGLLAEAVELVQRMDAPAEWLATQRDEFLVAIEAAKEAING